MASFDPFPSHASAFHSSAMCIMLQIFCQFSCPALLGFNDWAFPRFHPHCKKINGGDLTSNQVWSRSGRMGHGGGRGPGNSSPQTAPNHHTKIIRASASVRIVLRYGFSLPWEGRNHHTINFSQVQVIEAEALWHRACAGHFLGRLTVPFVSAWGIRVW